MEIMEKIEDLSPHLFKTPQLAAVGSAPFTSSGSVENHAASIRCGDLSNKKYEILRQEIVDLISVEIQKKEEGRLFDQHLLKIDDSCLTPQDLDIFEKFKTKELKKEEFLDYQREIEKVMPLKERVADSSATLMAWIAGKVTSAEWMKLWDPETYKLLFPEEEKEEK